jgi:hypothetical protein
MDLQNFTGKLERGEAFVRAKAAHADTGGLSVHIKFTRAKGRDVNGYYRWDDRRMVLAVKQRLRYPRRAAYGVGTQSRDWQRLGGRPYRLLWHEETFASPDDLLVFVAGHEFWHFLCHSGSATTRRARTATVSRGCVSSARGRRGSPSKRFRCCRRGRTARSTRRSQRCRRRPSPCRCRVSSRRRSRRRLRSRRPLPAPAPRWCSMRPGSFCCFADGGRPLQARSQSSPSFRTRPRLAKRRRWDSTDTPAARCRNSGTST